MLFPLWIFLGFQALVMAHELGHYAAARALGLRVEAISLGIGKAIWSWKPAWMDSTLRVGWVPFGGFVELEGEHASNFALHAAFRDLSWRKRVAFHLAGPAVNIFLALVIGWVVMTHLDRRANPFGGLIFGSGPSEGVGGPVSLLREGASLSQMGGAAFGLGLAVTSLNLGVFNLLPIPTLDGGHLLLIWWELVTRRRVTDRWRVRLVVAGAGLLVAVGVMITLVELLRP